MIAARAIHGRVLERFGGRAPTPEEVLADDPDELRNACGLSRAKVSFLRSLAEHVVHGELELDRLGELSDEEIESELVAVKGIGPWSAQIFLMAQLGRPDVLAPATSASAARSSAPTRSPACRARRRSSRAPRLGARTARRRAGCCGARSTTRRSDPPPSRLAPRRCGFGAARARRAPTRRRPSWRRPRPRPAARRAGRR
ncbi:MAG: DNA-3-methyladenine glycosylase family protein [Solirubrobacteraceae bacterium]